MNLNRVEPSHITSMADVSKKKKEEEEKKPDGKCTDVHGEIEFSEISGSTTKTAKYVKRGSDTSGRDLYKLLTEDWSLDPPNLIISVTGGQKNFALRPGVKEEFQKSLIKASEGTGAWITTSGIHAGATKHVGEAIETYAAINDDKKKVVTIGIAPLCVHGKEVITIKETTPQQPNRRYTAKVNLSGEVVLDHNLSHFILVDGKSDRKYWIDLRTKLEGYIADQSDIQDVKVMIVCVIVHGDLGSLETVAGSIENGTPVVVVGGSGGWADVLAEVSNMELHTVNKYVVKNLISKNKMMEPKPDTDELDQWTKLVQLCISDTDLLSVYTLDTSRDLDIAILEALLKADTAKGGQSLEQLKLAMAWNRSDIAKSQILNNDAFINEEEISKLFVEALQQNKHGFCEIFLEYGVDLKKYFAAEHLVELYKPKYAPKDGGTLKEKEEDLVFKRVENAMKEYLGHSYTTKSDKSNETYSAISKIKNAMDDPTTQSKAKRDDPHRAIFQWAILMNYQEIAKHVWKYLFEAMPAAIMATKILKTMAGKVRKDREKRSQMRLDADKYEALAVGILEKWYSENSDKAIGLLVEKLPKWGRYSCLEIASEANDKRFISQPGVQYYLDKVWRNELADTMSTPHIICAGICPLLILSTIQFKDDDESEVNKNRITKKIWRLDACCVWTRGSDDTGVSNSSIDVEMGNLQPASAQDNGVPNSPAPSNDSETETRQAVSNPGDGVANSSKSSNDSKIATQQAVSDSDGEKANDKSNCSNWVHGRIDDWSKKLWKFYNAPVVIFWMNVLSFMLYLILFAYVLLSDFQISSVSVSVPEYVLLGWTSTLLLEEIREFVEQEARDMRQKFSLHIDAWNIMDLGSLIAFYVAFSLRWFQQFLVFALILYSIAFMIQCVRIVHIFAVHEILGPKIMMVGKMLKDLSFFLFILVVFLLAYGVASQALLYPNESSFGQIIVGIIYRPYWQIYGELFLDEINYDPNTSDLACDDSNPDFPRCPQQNAWVPIISAVYLLFANVLLLNLLIAMFSYTFDNVERQSNEVWKFQRYKLIIYYSRRPPVVPPLVVFYHMFNLLQPIFRLKRDKDTITDSPSKNIEDLRKWQHWHAQAYIREKNKMDESTVDRQLEKIKCRIDNIMFTAEDLRSRLGKLEKPEKSNNIN